MAGEEITANCRRVFAPGAEIHADFALSGLAGRITAIFGPSGCGKSTCLRLLAGLERPDFGTIRYGNIVWADPVAKVHESPQGRGVGLLTQDPALFPHLSVAENVGYGLKGLAVHEVKRRVREILELIGLSHRCDARPHQLSGGEGQRVALARALVRRPRWILLDEPFSGLDEALRAGVRTDLKALLQTWAVPTVLVTHDRSELELMAEDLVVMEDGKVLQTGAAADVMAHPISLAAARVLGFENLHPLTDVRQCLRIDGRGDFSHLAFRAEEAVIAPRGSGAQAGWVSFPGVIQAVQGEGPLVRLTVDAGFSVCVLISKQYHVADCSVAGGEVEVRVPENRCLFLS